MTVLYRKNERNSNYSKSAKLFSLFSLLEISNKNQQNLFSLHRRNANSQLIAIQNSCLTLNIPRELTLFLLECWIFLCLPSIMQVYFIYLQTVNNCFRHLNKGNNCFLFYQDIKIKEIICVLHKNLKRIIFYDIPPT